MRDTTKLCELLGVDELRVAHGLNHSTVSIRIGTAWLAGKIDFKTLAESENMQADIGRVVFELVGELKREVARVRYLEAGILSVDEARGEDLDRIALSVGVTREPERRPSNRFEAIAEELEKL